MEFDPELGHVRDEALAEDGADLISWSAREMPVLMSLRERFAQELPLRGRRIAACLHVTSETANLVITLQAAGASVRLCASNPLTTNDAVAAALARALEIPTFAIKGEDSETYYNHIAAVLESGPNLTMDDGADLVSTLHRSHIDLLAQVIGGTEETTTGVVRLRAMAADGALKYPIIAVNQALTKHMFDNRYGTGQSTIDGILRATNTLLAAKTVVVGGYGWCGRGVAMRAAGMGAHVIVCEVDPVRALEAAMDGYRVMSLDAAAPLADLMITVTGNLNVVDARHIEALKDGVILANSGHFNAEINVGALAAAAKSVRRARPMVDEYTLGDGRRVNLLSEGRLVNLSAAEGHPSAVMDMSFANQALSAVHLVQHHSEMQPGVYDVPGQLDAEVARLKLASMGIGIDSLTDDQVRYMGSWKAGT